jgi:hypothetical protein
LDFAGAGFAGDFVLANPTATRAMIASPSSTAISLALEVTFSSSL